MVSNRSDLPNHDNHNIEFANDSFYDFHESHDVATNNTDNNNDTIDVVSTDCVVNNANSTTTMPHRAACLPPGLQFGIHLQRVLLSHRGVDLKLHDEIMDLIELHSRGRKTDLSTVKLYRRSEVMSTLTTVYNMHHLKHTTHNVTLSDSSVVSVPVFDVKAIILSILQDPKRMRQENLAQGYDVFTGCATEPITSLDEIHTGALWSVARDKYCKGVPNAFPLPLICFYDKTHTDLYGSLSCAPFLMSFAFFNENARSRDEFYEVLAYIPNLTYGSGKSNPKHARNKLQDEHKCLTLVTEQLQRLSSGFEAVVLGKRVTIKLWIHFIAGDTSGHNNIVGQFNSSSASFPYRDCKCNQSELCNSIATCSLTTIEDYDTHKQQQTLHHLSLHDIDNAFMSVPFGDVVHGVFGCVPAEMLHVSGNGIMQYMLGVANNIIGSGSNKQMNLHRLDILHQNMVRDALTQSEKDMPRMSDRNGVTDGTKMSASERVGNIFILLCAMHTHDGTQLFCNGCHISGVRYEDMKQCLKLQLGFEVWVNQSNKISDVENATLLVGELITLIKSSFPRTDGNGWCIPKMHSLAKMIHYMLQFGKAKNFCGQVGERVLKSVVKNHAQQTQRRVNVFADQCADRQFESTVLNYAYNDMENTMTGNVVTCYSDTLHHVQCKGKHTIVFDKCDAHGRGETNVTWADKLYRGDPHAIVLYALRTHATANNWKGEFSVHGYTSARITLERRNKPVLFYAYTEMYGSQRDHFCMVEFSDGDGDSRTTQLCPARIILFVEFITPEFPTPCSSNRGNQVDTSIYAVIHTATDYLSWEKLSSNFICPFTLGDPKTCVYIVDIQNICEPIFVFNNYGKSGSQLFCSLPYRRWGTYFQHRIK
jgi:hypothetical protein